MGPFAGVGRTGGMDGADTTVDERLHCRIGVIGAARIVRVVDHAGNAGIDAADGGEVVGDIMVLRPVCLGEGKMSRVAVIRKRRRIGIDAAKLCFPGMAVAIDETGDDDRVQGVDHLRARGIELGGNGSDLLSLDQQVPPHKIADHRIHAHDGAAPEEDALPRIDGALTVKSVQVLRAGRPGKSGCRPGGECGARLQRGAPRDPHVGCHGMLPGSLAA